MAVAVVQRIIQLNSGHVQGVRRWWLAASGVAAATTTGLRRKKSTTTVATGTGQTEGTAVGGEAAPGGGGRGQGAADAAAATGPEGGATSGGAGFGGAASAASGAGGGSAGFGGGFPGMGGGIGDKGGGTRSSGDGAGGGSADAEDVQRAILEAALPFVHQVGWSREALSMGAEAAGYPGVAHGIFTGGGADLVLYFIASCNARLEDSLRASPLSPAPPPEERARFVQAAVRQRLEMVVPYVNRWPQALALQANPRHAPSALALLLTLVDDICFFAGDRDVDFSWYTHRITLAGIYKATELYMIQDKSEEYQKTWNFLGRCIDDSTTMQKYLQQSKGTQIAKETITAAFVTARNILGLNTAR